MDSGSKVNRKLVCCGTGLGGSRHIIIIITATKQRPALAALQNDRLLPPHPARVVFSLKIRPMTLDPLILHVCVVAGCWLVASSLLIRFPVLSPAIPSHRRAPKCKVFAHRGAAHGTAENTLQAFQAALQQVARN
jgi:hypothetical protein